MIPQKKWILIVLFVLTNCFVFSQNSESNIRINARSQENKILLRWAIDNPVEWQRALKTGFTITKFVVKRNDLIVKPPESIVLTKTALVPQPLQSWMDLIQKDNNAAIIAQAIYGDSFDVTGAAKEGKLSKIVSIAQELDQRYTFALFAADMSFEGSLKAGWAFVDNDVKKNELYAYQISVANKKSKIKPATYVIGLENYVQLPYPTDFNAVGDDRKIMLSWDYETYKNIFSSFMIEKSEDNINFTPISKTPIVNLNRKADKLNSKRIFYVDTIKSNDKVYNYRLFGISSFGEKGKVSPSITAQGLKSIEFAPRMKTYVIHNENEATIEWEYPKESEKEVQNFEINVSDKDGGIYNIVEPKVAPTERKYRYDKLEASNYFTVTAVGKNNKKIMSQSILVQPIDSIPPAKPTGLEGKIDTLGVVKLNWNKNLEKDLLGYRIIRSNYKNEEMVDIHGKSIINNFCNDKASLTLMTKKLYYRVVAEDRRHNISAQSDLLEITKPDIIPPSAPIFKDFDSKDGKVFLTWVRSYSDDVVAHSLQRKEIGQKKFVEILAIKDTLQNFVDTRVEKNKTYEYAILAKDENNLWSTTENSRLTVKVLNYKPVKVLKNVIAVADREKRNITISWNFNAAEGKVTELTIYKSLNEEPLTVWKVVAGNVKGIIDKNLKMNTNYKYHILPTLKSNAPAKGEDINITY